MALLLQLAVGTVTTTSVAVITVPANQIWEVRNIFIQQPSTAVLKTVAIGRGTLTTVADADAIISRSLAAGIYSENISCPIALAAAATLDMLVSAGTTELTYCVEGYKTLLA
jgi:hypothetical protein